MDSTLNRDLLNAARRAGASDCLIVESQSAERMDELQGAEITHANSTAYRAEFYAVVDNGLAHTELVRNPRANASHRHLEQLVVDAVRAAHIVNAWGMCHRGGMSRHGAMSSDAAVSPNAGMNLDAGKSGVGCDLRAMVCPTSAQNTAAEWAKFQFCSSFDADESCHKKCSIDACLASHDFNAAPMLQALYDDMTKRYADIDFGARQRITHARKTFYFLEETIFQNRFETQLEQSVVLQRHKLRLPAILFDGIWTEKDTGLVESRLTLPQLAPALMRTKLTTSESSNAPKNVDRVVLSPWAAAVLLHETQHIGLNIEFSSSIIVDRAQNFCLPPRLPNTCRGIAVAPLSTHQNDGNRSNHAQPRRHEPDFAAVGKRAFIVDAPIQWMRHRHSIVDVSFHIAAIANVNGYEQHFKSLHLRFDLAQMWKNASVQSAYTHAVSLPCHGAMASYVLPWIAVDGCVIDGMA